MESHQDAATAPVRLYYTGWSSSTGEADWGLRPLFAGDKTPPSMYNISYYKNPTVDADIMKALGTTDRAEKTKLYTEVEYKPTDILLFGPEPGDIPDPMDIMEGPHVAEQVRLPMRPSLRSLNLTNCASIAIYEAWRQLNFKGGA